jgi:hypothetical protein
LVNPGRAIAQARKPSRQTETGSISPNTVHWTYDTYALSNVAGKAMVKRGEDTWFFVTADYAWTHRSSGSAGSPHRCR